jgi:uncharacterized protein (TIGR03083 family)
MASHPAVVALRRSHGNLRALVEPMSPKDLVGPSYDRDWTIAQVLSHLGSGAVIGQLGLDAALAGAPAPEFAQFQAVWDEWNAKDPQAQALDCLRVDEAYTAAWEAVPDERLPELSFSLGPMQLDGTAMVGLRLAEHAMHTWDVAVALDPTALVDAAAIDLLVDMTPMVAGFASKPVGEPGDIVVATSAPERRFVVEVGERVALRPAILGDGPAAVELPAEAFTRLVYGRLDPELTPSYEDVPLVEAMRKMFPGF